MCFVQAQLKDPLHPSHSLLPLLSRAEKIQSEQTRMQLLDEAPDVECVASELVRKTFLKGERERILLSGCRFCACS